MQKLTIVAISCLLLLTQIPNVFANSGNISKGIDRIEIKDGLKTIYYKNGLREVFFSFSESVNVETTTQVIPTPIRPIEPFPIDKIFRIIKQIVESLSSCGVGSTLLAWTIWNVIKRLRRGRPRDYRGVTISI